MSGAWLCAQQSLSGGLSIPHFPACFPAQERPGHPLKHELLFGGLWNLALPR